MCFIDSFVSDILGFVFILCVSGIYGGLVFSSVVLCCDVVVIVFGVLTCLTLKFFTLLTGSKLLWWFLLIASVPVAHRAIFVFFDGRDRLLVVVRQGSQFRFDYCSLSLIYFVIESFGLFQL